MSIMDMFGYDFKDDDGTLYEYVYWATNGRCYRKIRVNGVEVKARRISVDAYISAWESYRNY